MTDEIAGPVYVHESVMAEVRRRKNDPELQRRMLEEKAVDFHPLTPEQRKALGLEPGRGDVG